MAGSLPRLPATKYPAPTTEPVPGTTRFIPHPTTHPADNNGTGRLSDQ